MEVIKGLGESIGSLQKMIVFKLIPSFFIMSYACCSFASDPSEILYTYEIAGAIESKKQTIYSDFVNKFISDLGLNKKQKLPYKRSIMTFLEQSKSCLFPGTESMFNEKQKENLIFSHSLLEIDLNAISFGRKPFNTLKELKGKVAITLYQTILPEDTKAILGKVFYVEKESQAINLLKINRGHLFIAPGEDVLKNNPTLDLNYSSQLVLGSMSDKLVCHNQVKSRGYIEHFNKAINY